MLVRKLHIRSMGHLHGKELVMGEGLTLCHCEAGEGGALLVFLRDMLYGGEGEEDFGGSLSLTSGGRDFRLVRNFFKKARSFEMRSEATDQAFGEEKVTRIVEGCSREVFENAVRLHGLKSQTGPDIAREISGFVQSASQTGDRYLSLEKATQFLKMHRKDYTAQKERLSRESDKERQRIQARIDAVGDQLRGLQGKKEKARAEADQVSPPTEKEREKGRRRSALQLRTLHKKRNAMMFLSSLGFLLLFGFAALLLLTWGKPVHLALRLLMVAGVAAGVGIGLRFLLAGRRLMAKEQDLEEKRAENQKAYEREDAHKRRLVRNVKSLAQQERDRSVALSQLKDELDRYQEDSTKPRPQTRKIEALNLAMERLQESSMALREERLDALIIEAGKILEKMTQGAVSGLSVGQEGRISLREGGRLIEVERESRGRAQQTFLALQLSFSRSLSGTSLPILGEEIGAGMDEKSLTQVLHYLAESDQQVILSTSSGLEEEVLAREKIPFEEGSLLEGRRESL